MYIKYIRELCIFRSSKKILNNDNDANSIMIFGDSF